MTRRERLEAKLEKRGEWADKAKARSEARYETASKMADAIPLGQPILVGHHSEKRDRSYRERVRGNFEKAFEERQLSQHHEQKAEGLSRQLDESIFSDDADAIAQLEARIAEREADATRSTAINKAWRKAKGDVAALVASGLVSEKLAATIIETMRRCPWLKAPLSTTNTRANIRRDKERIEEIRRRQKRVQEAEAAPNGVAIVDCGTGYGGVTYVRVTFAEKPAREILDALKAAGFSWGAGSWTGDKAKLPAAVAKLAAPPCICGDSDDTTIPES